jgi:hypothetical protein
VIVLSTLLYWFWESRAEGNLRIDLFLIYPVLLAIYIRALWKGFRYLAVPLALLIMLANAFFFVLSYDLFGKYPG